MAQVAQRDLHCSAVVSSAFGVSTDTAPELPSPTYKCPYSVAVTLWESVPAASLLELLHVDANSVPIHNKAAIILQATGMLPTSNFFFFSFFMFLLYFF